MSEGSTPKEGKTEEHVRMCVCVCVCERECVVCAPHQLILPRNFHPLPATALKTEFLSVWEPGPVATGGEREAEPGSR